MDTGSATKKTKTALARRYARINHAAAQREIQALTDQLLTLTLAKKAPRSRGAGRPWRGTLRAPVDRRTAVAAAPVAAVSCGIRPRTEDVLIVDLPILRTG